MRTIQDALGLSGNSQYPSNSIAYAVAISIKALPARTREISASDELSVTHVIFAHLSTLGTVCIDSRDGKQLFCLSVPVKAGQITESHIVNAINDASSEISTRFLISVDSAISSVHSIGDDIETAYQEALETLEYVAICTSGRPVSYCEYIENTKSYGYYYTVDKEKQLINLINAGAKDDAIELLDKIIKENCFCSCMPVSLFLCFKYDLAGTFIKAIRDIFRSLSRNVIIEVDPLKNLTSCVSVNELQAVAVRILNEIHIYSQGSARSNLTISVINYVEKNYANPNLSVSEMCNQLGVHMSHLSAVFKRRIGVGLSEYIRQVRVDKAKVLLKSTNRTISEVAKDVGYLCPHTFTRVFKTAEGVTPSRYREG